MLATSSELHLNERPQDDTPKGFKSREDQIQGVLSSLEDVRIREDSRQRSLQITILQESGYHPFFLFGRDPDTIDCFCEGNEIAVSNLVFLDAEKDFQGDAQRNGLDHAVELDPHP